jgi:hypothetical protein
MKGNKMSAILAILLMLSGLLTGASFIRPASAVSPVTTVQTFPSAVNYNYPAKGPGSTFYDNITVSNAVQLTGYQSGFTFNATALQVTNVTAGDFLIKPGMVLGVDYLNFAGTIDNVNGKVTAYVVTLLNTLLNQSGSGILFRVGFKVNPALWPPYTAYPAGTPGPVKMVHFNITTTDTTALILSNATVPQIMTSYSQVTDGTFSLSVTPTPPTASFFMTPYPINYWNNTHDGGGLALENFDASASTGGSPGYPPSLSVSFYCWNFGDGSGWFNVTSATTTHYYPAPPALPAYDLWTVTLIVNSTAGVSAPVTQQLTVMYLSAPPAVLANPQHVVKTYPTDPLGSTFVAYVDVGNVTHLYAYQAGFTFNPTYLQVMSVAYGDFLIKPGMVYGTDYFTLAGTINNVAGKVTSYAVTLLNPIYAQSIGPGPATGHLFVVTFKINPALWPPYTPGPVSMMHFSTSNTTDTDIQLILIDWNGTNITPPPALVKDGTFQYNLGLPQPPTAAFYPYPNPAYDGTPITFDASGSAPGWNGYAYVPIIAYYWNFNDGNTLATGSAISIHTFPHPGLFNVTLIVEAGPYSPTNMNSTTIMHQVRILVRTPCIIDVYTQNWRYIDPITLTKRPTGTGPYNPADLFRPGDFVQLFAKVTYNNVPVAGQLVSFAVYDNTGALVFYGTATSNAAGIAEYDFRIPWPSTGVTSEFGTWSAVATWQIGSNLGAPPWEVTQVDIVTFKVGWGLWITHIETRDSTNTLRSAFHRGEVVYVKLNVENDYMASVTALAAASLYDDLMVPIDGPALNANTFVPGNNPIYMPGVVIVSWAFVGTGTAKANIFSASPSAMGVSYCPEVSVLFTILP